MFLHLSIPFVNIFYKFFSSFLIVFTLYFTIPDKISLLQYHFCSKGTTRYLYVRCRINEKDALRKFSLASSFLYTRVYFVTVQYLHSYMFHKTVPAE